MDAIKQSQHNNHQTPLDLILGRLTHVESAGDAAYKASCPAHEDSSPSLSVSATQDGKVLLHCHAGCTAADVVGAAGLTMADLFPPKVAVKSADSKRVAATYDYKDKAGELLFQVVRFEPKDFRQRRRAIAGERADRDGWSWSTRGIVKVPYRLPEVLEAVAIGKSVWIVEGEKDVDTLAGLGLCATCNVGGAGKWRKECTEALRGVREVLIVPDRDDPGRNHALSVLKALAAANIAAKVIELPGEGKDVTDFIVAGGTREDLERLAAEAAAVRSTASKTAKGVGKDSDRHLTDTWLAEQVVILHGADLKYVGAWDKWLSWDGHRWQVDEQGEVQRRVKATIRRLCTEGAAAWDVDLVEFAIKSEAESRRSAAVSLARFEPSIMAVHEDLDRDPMLFNVENGTIELRTGTFRPHAREDAITKVAGVAFNPSATCPTWERFLFQIMGGDAELVAFIQRATGYSLTGNVGEQVLFFCFGAGANGKSTLAVVLLRLLGGYGKQAAPGLLLAKRGEAHPTEQADLFGARLVISQEVEQGRALAEVTVKQLTGGDKVKARRMREDFWEFDPTHKLWLCANHKPIVRGTDLAIWRRICLIPFAVTIPEAERDRGLPQKLMTEMPGILNWAIRGCLDWQRGGLKPPKKVQDATAEYRSDMDVLGEFIAEVCILDPHAQVRSSELYRAFKLWAEDSGERVVARKSFGTTLTERPGLSKSKSHGHMVFHGLRLREDPSGDGGDDRGGGVAGGGYTGRFAEAGASSVGFSAQVSTLLGDPAGPSMTPVPVGGSPGLSAPSGGVWGGKTVLSGSPAEKIFPGNDPREASFPPQAPRETPSATIPDAPGVPTSSGRPAVGTTSSASAVFSGAPAAAVGLPILPTPSYALVKTAERLPVVAAEVASASLVALDMETTGLDAFLAKPRLLQLGLPGGKSYVVDLFATGGLGPLAAALAVPILVGHNLQFDLGFLSRHFGFRAKRLFDTMVASKLLGGGLDLHTKGAHKLGTLVHRYLRYELPKDEQTSDWSGKLSAAQLGYAARDAACLLPLREVLVRELTAKKLVRVAKLEFDTLPVVVAMIDAGVGLDTAAWQALVDERGKQTAEALAELKSALGVDNPNSQPQVIDALRRMGLSLKSTSSDALSPHSDHPVVKKLKDYRGLNGFVSRGPALLEAAAKHSDGRIRADFDPLAAPTGRFGCSGPNLQALPKQAEVRACIVPPPGHVFIVADYAQIELRVLASQSRDRRLLAIFKEGGDPHRLTASLILGKPLVEVTSEERDRAKAVNFGFAFGMGAKRFVIYAHEDYGVTFSLAEAERFRAAYLRAYPGVAEVHRLAGRHRFLEVRTASGRLRLFPNRETGFTDRLNTPVQGTAADGLKQAMILLQERLPALGARIVLCVHDELLVEAPLNRADEVKGVVQAGMREGMATFVPDVPILVEADVRNSWAKQRKQCSTVAQRALAK